MKPQNRAVLGAVQLTPPLPETLEPLPIQLPIESLSSQETEAKEDLPTLPDTAKRKTLANPM
jgi:hypothetical protein